MYCVSYYRSSQFCGTERAYHSVFLIYSTNNNPKHSADKFVGELWHYSIYTFGSKTHINGIIQCTNIRFNINNLFELINVIKMKLRLVTKRKHRLLFSVCCHQTKTNILIKHSQRKGEGCSWYFMILALLN